jgi:hypothetical protein
MARQCVTTVCVALFLCGVAGVASATAFNVAHYTCTDLYGVASGFSASNPEPNFQAYSLTEAGTVSGLGNWSNLDGSGAPGLPSKVALQCGPAGFGPASFSGTYGSLTNPIVSNNGNYTNAGLPTAGFNYNTGVATNNDYQATFAGNDSGTLAFSGGGAPGIYGGHYWSSGGGYKTPSGFSTALGMSINSAGLIAGGDCDVTNGTGSNGEVYNPGTQTTATMPGAATYINNLGEVSGTEGFGGGFVWSPTATTYWPAGTTALSGMIIAQSMSQNGRYVAGFEYTGGPSTGVLYDASTHSIVESFTGEAYAVNNNGWLGGDTESDAGFGFSGTAWLWDGTTQWNLNTALQNEFPSVVSGYRICAVWGINDSGQILVWGMSTAGVGDVESFLLTPTPEPSTLVLLASGLIGLSAYTWRKRK